MDITKSREESRKQFEYEAGKALRLPTSIIELARKGDGYDHAFDSMNIMHPLNGWWHWWKAGRESIEVERMSPTGVPSNIVYQLGGSGISHDQMICEGYSAGFNAALRTAGIRIKGESDGTK